MNALQRECQAALASENVRAFLQVIRAGETSHQQDAYRTIVGGGRFDSFADHPRQLVEVKSLGVRSTAAGAYQFLSRTWDECAKALELPDFTPASQDLAAVFLIRRRRALVDAMAGRLQDAIAKCCREWASLPGSPYGQPTRTLRQAIDTFRAFGGVLANDAHASPVPAPAAPTPSTVRERVQPIPAGEAADYAAAPAQPSTPHQEPAVSFSDIVKNPATSGLLSLVNPLLGLVPQLAQIFMDKEGTTVPERNVAAAVAIADAAQKALTEAGKPAANLQQVVETVAADPGAKDLVRRAILADCAHLIEAGGGGIAGARDFLAKASGNPAMADRTWRIVAWVTYAAIAFLVLANLLAIVAWGISLWRREGVETAQQLMTQVITADIGAAMSAIAFWLGSSWGSKQAKEAA
jgi:muramidase (phage lysozyme)